MTPSTKTIAAAIVAGLLAAGCGGGDDEDAGSGASPTDRPAPAETAPDSGQDDRAAAVQKCLEQARRIPDSATRRTVEETCRAAETGDTTEALEAARRQCLDGAEAVPAGDVRDRLRAACERISE